MPAIAWVGIGCGGLVLIGLIIFVVGIFMAKGKIEEFAANPEKMVAEAVISGNPEIEKISADDAAGTITFRVKGGEPVTLTYKDIAEGKLAPTPEPPPAPEIDEAPAVE